MHRAAAALIAASVLAAGCSGGSRPTPIGQSNRPDPSGPSASPTASPTASAVAQWPTYHGSNSRAGVASGPVLSKLRVAASVRLDAAAYAQPIVAVGLVIVATENDTVYGIRPASQTIAWRTHLATATRRSDLPCGNIDPSGITGTPAYDGSTGSVFVVTESGDAHHTLVAVDARSGAVRWRRDLDVLGNRDRHAEQQRGALLVQNGRVYVPFGGRFGDCGNYVGYLASVPVTGNGVVSTYAVPTAREAGMWAAPGPVVGPGGDIYVASGNGAELGGNYDGSDSVIRLTSSLHKVALFAPSSWAQDNADDLDLGSMSPAVVGEKLVIAGKRGTVYLLSSSLGGVGGQLATLSGCAAYGGAAVTANVVVLPCNDGLRAVAVSGNQMHWLWRASGTMGSPIVCRDVLYAFDGSSLVELSLSGRVLHRVHVGDVTRFTTPVPVGNSVVVATTSHVVFVTGS